VETPAKLTDREGNPVEVLLSEVDTLRGWMGATIIVLKSGERVRVKESPERVHAELTKWTEKE
jgi:hypothetical protein